MSKEITAKDQARVAAAGLPGSKPAQWGSERVNRGTMHGLWALTNRELQKWYKVPVLLLMSLIQPIVWLGLFGKAMNFGGLLMGGSFNIPGLNIPKQVLDTLSNTIMQSTFGTADYFSFLAVGMLSFVCLFTAMFSGMSVLWDRRLGFLDKVLSTPVSRGAIIMGKVLSSVVRSLAQAAVVLLIAIPLGLDLGNITLLGVLGTFVALFLMTLGFSALFLTLALRSTDWQSQMAIMNLLNLPLLFGSNALFPSKLMPSWLQAFVSINPISYATDAGRQLLLGTTGFASLGFDFAYLSGFALLLSAAGVLMSWKLLTR